MADTLNSTDIKYLTSVLSKSILKDFASENPDEVDETDIADLWIEEYFKSGKDKDGLFLNMSRSESMHGIGSPELFTALVVPIVVAIVTDVVIPYYQQKREAKLKSDKDLRKAQLKVKLKGESEKIIVLAGSTNAKKIRKVLDQLSRDVLERIE